MNISSQSASAQLKGKIELVIITTNYSWPHEFVMLTQLELVRESFIPYAFVNRVYKLASCNKIVHNTNEENLLSIMEN